MIFFDEIYEQQKSYNKKIRADDPKNRDEWTEIYLLGLVSEINEVLDDIKWKRHRKSSKKSTDTVNLGFEFADIMKYTLSLWELWGFSPGEVLQFVKTKSEILDEMYRQEFEIIPSDRLVVITDIDGTLGDWRSTFINWASSMHNLKPAHDNSTSLRLDYDLRMSYADYYALKEEFERSGQYQYIFVYPDAPEFLRWLKSEFNAYIIAQTDRPWNLYHRIWGDTWSWIKNNHLAIDQLRVGGESRILLADLVGGDNVLMLEDDIGLMLRAAYSGIKVIGRKHPYNREAVHENIRLFDNFNEAKESICNDYATFGNSRATDESKD